MTALPPAAAIVVCGSMAFIDRIEELADSLRAAGHRVETPDRSPSPSADGESEIVTKRRFIDDHLAKIRRSDAIIVANYDKHGIAGYVGASALMEAAVAYALSIPVYTLQPAGPQPNQLEIQAVQAGCLELA